MATFFDQFYEMDPFSPPPAGTTLNVAFLEADDADNSGTLSRYGEDLIDGSDINRIWDGDTVTVELSNGTQVTYTGVTFYLDDGRRFFTPMDGQTLATGTLISTTAVSSQTNISLPRFGPTCFTAGTLIDTARGPVPVETLRVGDTVLTDGGQSEPIVWTGATIAPGDGKFAAVVFAPGTLGNTRPLAVSPQHRVLLRGWRAEIYFGLPEVLATAVHLVNGKTVTRAREREVHYVHVMCARPVLLRSDGAVSESFNPGAMVREGDAALDAELRALFPDMPRTGTAPARPLACGKDARALIL
ncbi:Hint domain-containing protein [Poseidonocella sedimentorum]|uniref:Hint domain-containing protein n=1 Tax=Poseidonocella sedimentorum TaxID=871652 RepID=A0A1I6EQW6_9RHOB|nr:Hint domain-containing protein [Poseidonocella sedimentorum]SFR20186.1 Hint domain-containing protein [Poseidonocella sedimentorum]